MKAAKDKSAQKESLGETVHNYMRENQEVQGHIVQ
jgi:hypothetical protein